MDMEENLVMTAAPYADPFLSPHFYALYMTLCAQLPFITNDEARRIVEKAHAELCSGLQDADPAVEARKARFSFFNLPAELRNRIYEMVVPVSKDFCVQTSSRKEVNRRRTDHISLDFGTLDDKDDLAPPHLCHVSKQIRAETLPIFLGQNKFFAHVDTDYMSNITRQTRELRDWLNMLGRENARLVREVVIRMPLPQSECTWRGSCSGDEPCTKDDCRAWAPKSALDVAKTLRVLGAGVPLTSFKAEFGATVNGHVWSPALIHRPTGKARRARDMSEVVDWTPVQIAKPGEEVDITRDDVSCPIWGVEDVDVDKDRDTERWHEWHGPVEAEWYD